MLRSLVTIYLCTLAAVAQAHEFWIEPLRYQVSVNEPIEAELRVGQEMKGPGFAYFAPKFHRFDISLNNAISDVEGRAGDRPALNQSAEGEGLAIISHVTTDLTLTYRDWEKFVAFARHKDFSGAIERHKERGLPEVNFRETYSRHAKSLVAVGHGKGQDREVGLLTEIVALANPYTDSVASGLPVKVLYQQKPRAGAQVELFEKSAEGDVTVTLYRTDAEGIAVLPVKPGFSYLVDAVVLREIGDDSLSKPVWETLWAALTFAVP